MISLADIDIEGVMSTDQHRAGDTGEEFSGLTA